MLETLPKGGLHSRCFCCVWNLHCRELGGWPTIDLTWRHMATLQCLFLPGKEYTLLFPSCQRLYNAYVCLARKLLFLKSHNFIFFFWFVLGEWVYPWCQRRLPAISKLDIFVPNIQSPLLINFPVQRQQECCRTTTPISYFALNLIVWIKGG